MTIDEALEGLWDCTLELCKETYEWNGTDMGNKHANIEYRNYLISNPITFNIPVPGEYDPSIDMSSINIQLGNGVVPDNIGVSPEMFKYIYNVESGVTWGSKLPDKLLKGKDVEGQGNLTYGAGLLYHPNGKRMMDVKRDWTQEELDKLFAISISNSAKRVRNWASKHNITLNQNQVDSILSACYNFGFGFLTNPDKSYSKTVNMIKENPNNPNIGNAWAHISDAQGKKFPGLVRRRRYEANHYFA